MTVCVPAPSVSAVTKSLAAQPGETAVNSLQVYVFDVSGTHLEAYGAASASSLSLDVTLGPKIVAAVVNAPQATTITSLGALKAKTSDLSENSPGSFVMMGSVAQQVSASTTVTVPVSRVAARVVIKKVTNALSMEQYASEKITVDKIYLVNAGGLTSLDGSAAPAADAYYNKMADCGDLPSLLKKELSSTSLAVGESFSSPSYFYTYPNGASEDISDGEWAPRKTRLVVQTTILGETWYYPITIESGVEANCSYEIEELRITRLGGSSPDQPIEIGSASFSIVVQDWNYSDIETVII